MMNEDLSTMGRSVLTLEEARSYTAEVARQRLRGIDLLAHGRCFIVKVRITEMDLQIEKGLRESLGFAP